MVYVFNNTGSSVTFSTEGEQYTAVPLHSTSFVLSVPLEATIAGCELSYDASHPPSKSVRTGFFRAHIQVQMESGGKIYVLEPLAEAPVDVSEYPQPRGYPLTPRTNGECDWSAGPPG
jgi:hypothetical protein